MIRHSINVLTTSLSLVILTLTFHHHLQTRSADSLTHYILSSLYLHRLISQDIPRHSLIACLSDPRHVLTSVKKHDSEAVHYEAAMIVSGATKICNLHSLLGDLQWETLVERRPKHRLLLFYKMQYGTSPNYLSDLLPQHTEHSYPLRNLSDIPNIHCNTQPFSHTHLRFYY